MRIPLIKPYINQKIKERVCKVLDSGLLTEGEVTKEFESKFVKFIGCKHAIAVTSCTTGLEIALRCLGIGPDDEVIIPDYTYPATGSVVCIVGAKLVIIDINRKSMLIDFEAIEKAITPKTKAIIPVSLFGNPLNYDKLNSIKKKYGVYIIEDAACSIGSAFKNKMTGNWADISVFSLHPRKFITTGEGGMVTTNNKLWADWMNSYKRFGISNQNSKPDINFDIIGTNYKLNNILSAIGLEQLKIIEKLIKRRQELADNYKELLFNIKEITLPLSHSESKHSYQSFCIFSNNRNEIMRKMKEQGIEVQIGTYSLHLHNAFNKNNLVRFEGDLRNSKWVYEHCLTLPLYHELTFEHQKLIIDSLIKFSKH